MRSTVNFTFKKSAFLQKFIADHFRRGVQFVMPCIFFTAKFTVKQFHIQTQWWNHVFS